MKRPKLEKTDLDQTTKAIFSGKPFVVVTMSEGQWDGLLQAAYEQGHTLLELDIDERPVAAYRRK